MLDLVVHSVTLNRWYTVFQSTEEELTAATAYFDLFIRSLTEPGLLHSFISFIIQKTYDGQRIIDSLIQRIKAKSRVSNSEL